jgi:hypothetical protein
MIPIDDPTQVQHYRELAREMMLPQNGKEYEFAPEWISKRGWKVVPVESASRLRTSEIPRVIAALKRAGYTQCLAVVTEAGYLEPLSPENERLGDSPTCYRLALEKADFQDFNRQLGLFRSVLTDDSRSWAISCNESYNLFGGKIELLEALLGEPIEMAQKEFLEFASLLAKGNPDEPLMRVATRYAVL